MSKTTTKNSDLNNAELQAETAETISKALLDAYEKTRLCKGLENDPCATTGLPYYVGNSLYHVCNELAKVVTGFAHDQEVWQAMAEHAHIVADMLEIKQKNAKNLKNFKGKLHANI